MTRAELAALSFVEWRRKLYANNTRYSEEVLRAIYDERLVAFDEDVEDYEPSELDYPRHFSYGMKRSK